MSINLFQNPANIGLPLTVLFCVVFACLYRELKRASDGPNSSHKTWKIGFFDFCTVMEKKYILGWLKNIVLGPYHATEAFFSTQSDGYNLALVIITCFFVYFVLLLTAMLPPLVILVSGIWVFGVLAYLGFACLLAIMRSHVRIHRGYYGNPIEDYFACLLCYPSVCQQLEAEIEETQNSSKPSFR